MDRFTPSNTPCQDKNLDKEIFFPDTTDYPKIAKAKSICKQCDSKTKSDCLSFAFATKSQGIWGGTTDEERKSIKRKERRNRG